MATFSLRSPLFIPTTNFRLKSLHHPSLSTSFSIPTLSKTHVKPLSAASFEIVTKTDEDLEAGNNEQKEVIQIRANKKLKKHAGRLYVGNIPFTTTSNVLSELFTEAGNVLNAEIVYDRNTNRSRGFGFVNMASKKDAEAAIRMFDKTQLYGREIKVNFPEIPLGAERDVLNTNTKPSRGYVDSAHKLYAGNLGWGVSSESLKDAFSHLNGLLGAKVIFDRETGRSRGFGFVTFASLEEANVAIELMNGVEVEGRPLRLTYSTARETEDMRETTIETQRTIESRVQSI